RTCYMQFYHEYISTNVLVEEKATYKSMKDYIMHVYTMQLLPNRFYFAKTIEVFYPQFLPTIRAMELLSLYVITDKECSYESRSNSCKRASCQNRSRDERLQKGSRRSGL